MGTPQGKEKMDSENGRFCKNGNFATFFWIFVRRITLAILNALSHISPRSTTTYQLRKIINNILNKPIEEEKIIS